jgi:putative redox protein
MLRAMTEINVFYEGQLRTRCVHRESGQELKTDAPKDNFGQGELFSPTDLVAAALGSCVLTLMGIMAHKLKVDVTGLRFSVSKEMASAPSRRIKRLQCEIYCPQTFEKEIQLRLEQTGRECPVHQSLHPEIIQAFNFHWGIP